MAHFVKLNENNIVVDCIVIDDIHAPNPAPENSESIGRDYIASLAMFDQRLEGFWIQTSYNNSFRKQYAGIGFTYDADSDVFITTQPFPSWTLDANHDWQPPTPMPETEGMWSWDEDSLSWVDLTPAQ